MSKNIIGEPDKYELASVVTKNSRSKCMSIQLGLPPTEDYW